MATFTTAYPQNPWASITNKTRDWYVPELYDVFIGQAVYNNFVRTEFNFNGLGATQMFIDNLIMPHANTDTAGLRDEWVDKSYMGSAKRAITFERHFGGFAYHKYDQMITYWRQNGRQAALRNIINNGLGYQVTWTMEKLARNAMLGNTFATYGSDTGSKFASIKATDTIRTQTLRDMWLGMKERGTPMAQNSSFNTPGNIFCITTPGVVADLLDEADAAGSNGTRAYNFTDVALYTGNTAALNGEVGMYQRVRMVESNLACLYNAGTITAQTTITSPITAGDGAPDPATTAVDGAWYVGETAATHYVVAASAANLAVGDIVTLHTRRTSANGITNGVDFTDGSLQNFRIVGISGTHISFDTPVLTDFSTDLGGTVYAYLTKGRHIHTAVFMRMGGDGVVNGIMQPPQIYAPPAIDDAMAQYRLTWDAYLKYQIFNPSSFQVQFLAGSNNNTGVRYVS